MNELEKLNQKLLQKQQLLKDKDKVNKEYLLSASRDKSEIKVLNYGTLSEEFVFLLLLDMITG